MPSASTINVVTRQVVASLALAGLGNVVTTQRIAHNANLASRVNLSDPAVAMLYNGLVARFQGQGLSFAQAQGAAIAQLAGQVAQQAGALAFRDAFLISTIITIPAIVLPFLLRPLSRSRKVVSGAPGVPSASDAPAGHGAMEPV